MNRIYLDYAAATPIDTDVHQAMTPYLTETFYNPSAQYLAAKAVAKDIAEARSVTAHWLGARPTEIIFTAGGTEANNLAIQGIMDRFPDANVIVSAVEHESVLAPAGLYDRREVSVDETGQINVTHLTDLIDDETVLVSVMYANNEVGTIQPLRKVSQVIKTILARRRQNGNNLPLYLHTDACQAANYLDLHVAQLGVDLMTLNGGKIYGPKQSGLLYVKAGVALQPQILGGGQERNLRSGTENVAAIIGFARALQKAQELRHDEADRLKLLQQLFFDQAQKSITGIAINGSRKHRLPNNMHITIPGQDNERLLYALDEKGILCAAGSACSTSKEAASHVLLAMGLSEAQARSSLRFSFGRATTEDHVRQTVAELAKITA